MNQAGRRVAGDACGCAREATVAVASAQAPDNGGPDSSSSDCDANRTVDQWNSVGAVVCDQRSTGANHRVTSGGESGADQLATQESRVQRRESPDSYCITTKHNSCGKRVVRAAAATANATTGQYDSLKTRFEHFSASANQFNCEPSEEGASQKKLDWQQEQGCCEEVHEQQQQANCSLIRSQLGEQDATAPQRETDLLVGCSKSNEDCNQALELVKAARLLEAQAQVQVVRSERDHSNVACQIEDKQYQQQQQQQQYQIERVRDQSHEAQPRTLGCNLDKPETTPAHLETITQRQGSLVSANNPSFWTKLSNLSRSIIHQQRQQSFSDSSTSAFYAPDEITLDSDSSSFLAPEVLDYLETKKKQSNFPATTASVTALTSTGIDVGHSASRSESSMIKTSSRKRASGEHQDALVVDGNETSGRGDERKTDGVLQDAARKQEEQATRRRKKESTMTTAQITSQLQYLNQQQQQQQQQEMGSLLHEPQQINVGGQKVIKSVELHQPTINKMQQQQQSPKNNVGANEFELGDRLEQQTCRSVKPDSSGHDQVKLSITTNATNTTSTNTSSTPTTTRSSSASSLSSCILSESISNQSDEARLKWGKKMDFLLSIIGFAVDLANIWRFPYLVYKNGGGVFLIPYLTMLIFGGIPLFFLELCLGQYVKKGPITVWNKICPYMKGVGYCSILISWYVSFYYNVLIAWSVYFIYRSISSFGNKMPWEDCDNSWNTVSTCVSISQLKELCSHKTNVTLESCRKEMFSAINVTSPASEFFVKELSQIDQSSGLEDMGYLRPELVFCTMIVYVLHYFSLFRGLETSGKVVWVTATAPYMILSILLVRGLFLPGASMGIKYYLSPRLEKLADPQVWIDAAGQVFYSIGVGFGVHLTYASFNSHDNNCYRDCLMTSAVNALTSVYSGLVVFVYLGYMATNLGIEIDKVASEGYSLVFEVYPEALTTLPFARFWSILFFIMLLTLGIDSAMGGLEAVITGLEDEFKFAKRLSRSQLTGLVIFSSFLPALISCTQGGAYTLFWFDIYSAGVSLLFSALFETIGVVYCYGLDKFILNIESMLGRRPQFFYIICWKYISPTFLMGIIFMSIYTASVPTYRGYTFPIWSVVLGWCLAFSSVAAVPIVAIWTLYSSSGNKAISVSPSKSPRKPNASGALSATSGGSKNVSRKSTPSHGGHQCRKSMTTINYNEANQPTSTRATSSVINLPPDHRQHHHHCYKEGNRIEEEML